MNRRSRTDADIRAERERVSRYLAWLAILFMALTVVPHLVGSFQHG